MILLALAPLVVGAVVALAAPHLGRRMSPPAAAVLLTGTALSVAMTVGAMLCLAAIVGLKLAVPALRPSDWSTSIVRDAIPLPPSTPTIGGVVAGVFVVCASVHALRVGVRLHRATAAARSLPEVDGVAVIGDEQPQAYAVPGRPGRIVVSTGLLRTMTGVQRDVVIEHERSHLRHHHVVYAQLVRLAACANPLMWRVVPAVDVALERWADADAARAVGSRHVVAHTLGAVALSRSAVPGPALGIARHAVVERVRFLLEPPADRARLAGSFTAVAMVVLWAVAAWATLHVHGLVEAAEATYRSTRS